MLRANRQFSKLHPIGNGLNTYTNGACVFCIIRRLPARLMKLKSRTSVSCVKAIGSRPLLSFLLATQTSARVLGDPSYDSYPSAACASLFIRTLRIPACSNYEKECSFAAQRGTRNGQRPLETIIERRPKGRTYPSSPLPPPLFAVHTLIQRSLPAAEFLIRPAISRKALSG